jgi:hypothetical protein
LRKDHLAGYDRPTLVVTSKMSDALVDDAVIHGFREPSIVELEFQDGWELKRAIITHLQTLAALDTLMVSREESDVGPSGGCALDGLDKDGNASEQIPCRYGVADALRGKDDAHQSITRAGRGDLEGAAEHAVVMAAQETMVVMAVRLFDDRHVTGRASGVSHSAIVVFPNRALHPLRRLPRIARTRGDESEFVARSAARHASHVRRRTEGRMGDHTVLRVHSKR